MTSKKAIILYDAGCKLCNTSIYFVLKKDKKKKFCILTQQSKEGQSLARKFETQPHSDSLLLIQNNKVLIESEAVVQIFRQLPFPWRLFSVIKIIPKNWRDSVYRWVAANRYKWFGSKHQHCEFKSID